MTNITYNAWVVGKDDDKKYSGQIQSLDIDHLPENDVLIRVKYSSLNYKDALSATGAPGVTKNYPHTPGIDAAGIVEQSENDNFQPGDPVIVTSYDLGMNTPGGFGQFIRVPSNWVVNLPEKMSLKQSMVWGTAGFTAAMSVFHIVKSVEPNQGSILVTGATGGVGSLSVGILAHLGYHVTAVSGKQSPLLKDLGVKQVIARSDFLEGADRPLLKGEWAGVVDTVGGPILSRAIKSTDLNGIVTCCGNVASPDLPINVFPFILRGVSLIGIDSQNCVMSHREELWNKLADEWNFPQIEDIYETIGLEGLADKVDQILNGKISGRILVNADE